MNLKLVICNILVLCVYFWRCTGGLYINYSQYSKPWDNARYLVQPLLDYDYIQQNGWNSIIDVIPEEEEFWIAAKATPTPFVSWEGCARWLSGPNCTEEIKHGGSIADCLQECSQNPVYILLQGEICRCVDKNESTTCFEKTNIHHCKSLCPNNLNEHCGGTQDIYVSVYFRDQFPYKLSTENVSKENCVYAMRSSGNTPFEIVTSCYDDATRRYICNGSVVDHGDFLSWPQAFEKCGEKHAQLGFEQPESAPSRQSYWTSLRRSFEIDWMPTLNTTYSGCVTVKRDSFNQLILQVDECTRPHRCLYMLPGRAVPSSKLPVTCGTCNECSLTHEQLAGGMFGMLVLGLVVGVILILLLQWYQILNIRVRGTESNEFYPMTAIKRNNKPDRRQHFQDTSFSRHIGTEDGQLTEHIPETYEDLEDEETELNYDPLQAESTRDAIYYTNA